MTRLNVKAGGDINPARFVTLSDSHIVVESNSGDTALLGVSDEHKENAPQTGGSTLHASATINNQPLIHIPGEICRIEAGGTIDVSTTPFLKPDNDGKAVAATAASVAGAIALEDGASGELISCLVISPYSLPA